MYTDINPYSSKIKPGPDNYHLCIKSQIYKTLEINEYIEATI